MSAPASSNVRYVVQPPATSHDPAASCRRLSRRRRWPGSPGVAALVTLIALAGCQRQGADVTWSEVETRIQEAFPGVPSIDTAALSEVLQDPTRPLLLIDAREPAEFAVSHLPGAVRATSVEHAAELANGAPDGATIVAYCSVGYRSANLVAALRDRGLTDVYNLTGSIFRWANEDRPLYRGDVLVRAVHPFDEAWGVLLQADRRSSSPGTESHAAPAGAGPAARRASSSRSTGGR